jgi:NADPH:quinone reductase-like Zn-dependent oxidoreductase
MKAIVIRQFGGPEVLEYADAPEPEVGAGEVLVRVAAASINPIDILERAGLTKDFNPIKLPYVPGWDLSGTVIRVGPGVDGVSAGDKVLAWGSRTYAELCAVKAGLLAKVPDGLDLVEASALPLVTTTGAELIAVAAGVKAGQSVLVSGAIGGVGRSAVFAAKERGAKVIAGVLKKQLRAAANLGADEIIALDDEAAMKGPRQ